jgi:hypothetical protein
MEHNLVRYAKYYSYGSTKYPQEVMNPQEKLVTLEEISNFKKTICKNFTTFGL